MNNRPKNAWIEIFGWYGVAGVITAYALTSFSVVLPTNAWYQVLNISSALGVMIVSFYKNTYQPAIINLVWALIGFVALLTIFIK